MAVGIIWRKKILPSAHKGFSEAGGLGLDLWAELPGNGGGQAGGLGPLCGTFTRTAGRASLVEACPFGPGRRTDTRAGWAWLLFLALSVAVVLRIYTGSKTMPLSPAMPQAVKPYPSGMVSPLLG